MNKHKSFREKCSTNPIGFILCFCFSCCSPSYEKVGEDFPAKANKILESYNNEIGKWSYS